MLPRVRRAVYSFALKVAGGLVLFGEPMDLSADLQAVRVFALLAALVIT